MKIGIVPLTWSQFRQAEPDAWPQTRILQEVKQAGFDAVSAFPRPGQSVAEHLEYLQSFGLAPAPAYFSGDFWALERRDEFVARARSLAATARQMGLTELFVAVDGWTYVSRANGKTRSQLAGHVEPGDGLTPQEWEIAATTLNAIGTATLSEGVASCFHNHAGTPVETRAECDTLAQLTDPDKVFWGLDSGHLAFAGGDVAQFARDYAPRIKALHLKDVQEEVRRRAAAEAWDYGQASGAGIWTELGQGSVDFAGLFAPLRAAGFAGWVLSEIDVTQRATALESATMCRNFLRQLLGI